MKTLPTQPITPYCEVLAGSSFAALAGVVGVDGAAVAVGTRGCVVEADVGTPGVVLVEFFANDGDAEPMASRFCEVEKLTVLPARLATPHNEAALAGPG